jgi:hypothetical protein
MIDGPFGLIANSNILIGQESGERRNGRHGSGALQSQRTRCIPTDQRIGIAQLFHEFQNQQIGFLEHIALRWFWLPNLPFVARLIPLLSTETMEHLRPRAEIVEERTIAKLGNL